jgi:hypothetical protein
MVYHYYTIQVSQETRTKKKKNRMVTEGIKLTELSSMKCKYCERVFKKTWKKERHEKSRCLHNNIFKQLKCKNCNLEYNDLKCLYTYHNGTYESIKTCNGCYKCGKGDGNFECYGYLWTCCQNNSASAVGCIKKEIHEL